MLGMDGTRRLRRVLRHRLSLHVSVHAQGLQGATLTPFPADSRAIRPSPHDLSSREAEGRPAGVSNDGDGWIATPRVWALMLFYALRLLQTTDNIKDLGTLEEVLIKLMLMNLA